MNRRLRVGVVFGGRSGEHDVSLASARSVIAVMDPARYDVVPIGIDRAGRWLTAGDPMALLSAPGEAREQTPASPTAAVVTGRELVPGATGGDFPPLDVIFPVLHGPYGEDGTVQGLLELAGVPYVGCGVLASSLAMDKIASKELFKAYGLPVAPYRALKRKDWEAQPAVAIAKVETGLGYPVFVKPANLGSSIGVSKATDRDSLRRALDEACRYDRKLLIEQAIPNAREIECAVLGNDDPIASVPGEIVPSNEFYDYAAKYVDGRSGLLIPAPISAQLASRVREYALAAFLALDGAGLARVDFLLNDATGELFLNEINTLPGFTSISMYPKLWEASDISYAELVERLIDLAFERHADQARSATTL
jgi:D-alanine-D-alanine ligase